MKTRRPLWAAAMFARPRCCDDFADAFGQAFNCMKSDRLVGVILVSRMTCVRALSSNPAYSVALPWSQVMQVICQSAVQSGGCTRP